MRVLPGPTKSNQVLVWSPDGRWLAAGGSGDGVTLWDVDAGTSGRRVLGIAHGGEAMRFCPKSGRLYVAFRSGGFWNLDPETGEERRCRPVNNRVGYTNPAVADDGRTVVLRRTSFDSFMPVNRAIVGYTVADDGSFTEAWARPEPSDTSIYDFTFRPRTDQLFGLRWQFGGVQVFEWVNAVTGADVGSFGLASGRAAYWALSPDGSRVAWLSGHALYVRPLEGDAATLELPAIEGAYRRGLAWAPDGRTLAYTTGTTVRLLDSDTLTEVRALDWNIGKPRAVAFNPDGLRAAVSGDGGRGWVTVFDLEG